MDFDYQSFLDEEGHADYLREQYEEELRIQIVEDFIEERRLSYYEENPEVLTSSVRILNEANVLLNQSPTASLLLSSTAIETAIKAGILKPIIYGLIHSDATADIVSDATIEQKSFNRLKKLMFKLLADLSSIDMETFQRSGSNKSLWNEWKNVQHSRNKIAHEAKEYDIEEARYALSVAQGVLWELIPTVLSSLSLSIDYNGNIY